MIHGSPEVPPIQQQPVSNTIAWAITLIPLVGALAEYFSGKDLLVLYVALNVGLCGWDALRLKEAGYRGLTQWWILLVPVYLWQRASLLAQPRNYFFAWVIAFAASLTVPYLTRNDTNKKVACEIVSEILHEQDSTAPQCKGVTIVQDPGTGFVKATALLSDGTERAITIEDTGDSIRVQLLPQ